MTSVKFFEEIVHKSCLLFMFRLEKGACSCLDLSQVTMVERIGQNALRDRRSERRVAKARLPGRIARLPAMDDLSGAGRAGELAGAGIPSPEFWLRGRDRRVPGRGRTEPDQLVVEENSRAGD